MKVNSRPNRYPEPEKHHQIRCSGISRSILFDGLIGSNNSKGYIYIYIYIYIYMQISLNIIDILCLHIFFWIRSNQFPQNTIKVIREFERIQKKICRHKMSIMFNEICINEEMLPKYTYIYIYIYIYIRHNMWGYRLLSWRPT